MISLDHFRADLREGYRKHNSVPLVEQFRAQLFAVYDELFNSFCPQTIEEYGAFLAASIAGLTRFTRRVNAALLQQPATDDLFTIPYAAIGFLDPETNADVFGEFARPFSANQPTFARIIDIFRDSPLAGMRPPDPVDYGSGYKFDQKRFDRDEREFHKRHQKLLKEAEPLQLALTHSPFYHYAKSLLPHFDVQLPFDIPEDRWFEGCWVVAASGAGKTNLLRHIILRRIEQDATVIILDSKGDLFASFQRLATIKDRLVVLETTPKHPLAINPFDTKHPSEFLDYLFSVFNTGLTAHQSIPFNAIISLLQQLPNPTMETFWDIVVEGAQKYQDAVKELHPRDQRFFEKEIKLSRYTERLGDIQARLRILFGNKCLGPILESKKTRVNMRELLDSGKVICINNSYAELGPFGSEFLGRLFLALIWYAGRERKSSKPVYVFLDEAQYVIANDRHIDDMITQLRSKRISLTFAHQFLRQIDDPKVRGALDTCAIKFFNTTAEPLASSFFPNTSADELATIERGKFAAFVKFKTRKAEIVPVPPYPVHAERQTFLNTQQFTLMSDYEHHALLLTMRARYAQEPPTPPPPDDTIYEENHINPNLADQGGTYRTKLRLDVHGREWKWAEVRLPADMREGYRIKFPRYGTFRRDGTRGDLIHVLYRRKSDGPQTGPAELGPKPSGPKRRKSPPPRSEPLEDW